jgi:hypothetical protein
MSLPDYLLEDTETDRPWCEDHDRPRPCRVCRAEAEIARAEEDTEAPPWR